MFLCCGDDLEEVNASESITPVHTLSAKTDTTDETATDTTDEAATDSVIIDSTVHTFRVRNIGNLRKVFCDINPVHLQAAMSNGFDPITNAKSCYNIKIPVVKITSGKNYTIDPLTHSLPYLTKKASQLLSDIGKNFSDTIKARTGKYYKIRVTSLLRTENSITSLRRRNSNASDSSAHQYGTTFDISYVKYTPVDSGYILSQECLKNTLGEILFDLRNRNRCYVKYEVKQGCFHITAR